MRKPTIEEIAEATRAKCPFYFTKDTLKFFGQTMRSFKVTDNGDGRFKISAPSYWMNKDYPNSAAKRTYLGESVRYFNPATNDLEDE